MLAETDVMATVAVTDGRAARDFYEGVLGLTVDSFHDDSGMGVYRSGAAKIVVYPSDTAGKNPATSATWGVGERLEAVVEALKAKGVRFERYDIPGAEMRGDVHVMGGSFRAAWFRDPDGNILHVNSGD